MPLLYIREEHADYNLEHTSTPSIGKDKKEKCTGGVDCSCLGRATTDENNQVIAENHAHDHPPETACTVAFILGDIALFDYHSDTM